MSRPSLTEKLRVLQQRHSALQHELACLHRSRRSLQLRHAIAVQWCQVLAFRNLHLASHQQEADAPVLLQQLLEDEVALLQELTQTANAPSLEQLLQPNTSTIAPCTDPMARVRRMIATKVEPGAEVITAHSHAVLLQQTATTLGIKLQQLQALLPWEQAGKLQEIAAVWDRYFQETSSLILLRKQHVIEQALSINLETMQPDPEAAGKHQAAQAAAIVPALRLQEQQAELIAVGLRLYLDIVSVIHAERQQLQQQVSQLEAGPGSSSSSSDARSSDASSSSAGSVLEHLGPRQQQLQQQQCLANRLQVLLRKEYGLRSMVVGFIAGSLTYEQLSRVAVLSWPYGMRLLFVGTEIMQQREAIEQQWQLQLQLAN